LRLKDFKLRQCFFGEHLLNQFPDRSVAIVESEKTAILASVYFPQFVWLATGGKNGCRWSDRTVNNVLKKRNVVLFPDLGVYDDWKRQSELFDVRSVRISDLLKKHASDSERKKGLDIADYLLRFEYAKFLKT